MINASRFLCVLCVLAGAAGAAAAREVWTPETGRVTVEQMPRSTPEQRREYAYALLGLGQWQEGLRILKPQIKAEPDAEWVPRARLAMGRALLDADLPRRAFDVLDAVDTEGLDEVLRERVRDLQFEAARVRAETSLRSATRMLDRMEEYAENDEEKAFVMKEKADVARLAGYYLEAMSRYMDAIDAHPRSTWVPYNEYGLAVSQWEFARWLNLGLEDVSASERSFEDFVEAYPNHPLTARAQEDLQRARRMRWQMYDDVVDYYARREDRPWAGLPYLEEMQEEFPGVREEKDEEPRLRSAEIRDRLATPMPGRTWNLTAPGLVTTGSAE